MPCELCRLPFAPSEIDQTFCSAQCAARFRWIDPEVAFWGKVQKTDTCWLWIGACKSTGYGNFEFSRDARRRQFVAHRFAWELLREAIAPGMELDHLCRQRNCVNPDHLEVVSHAENARRAGPYRKGKLLKTHCKRGHPLPVDYRTRNERRCRECHRIERMESYYRLKSVRHESEPTSAPT